jgi:hypothetical protein
MVINIFLETCINKQVDKAISLETGQILAVGQKSSPKARSKDPLLSLKGERLNVPQNLDANQAKAWTKRQKSFANVDYMINTNERHNDDYLPLRTSDPSQQISDFWNYIYLYPITSMNSSYHKGSGARHEDEKNGIYHYQVGADRGLMKTIKFSKVDMQYIREARFFNHGHDGLMQLSAVYKATLNMIGNTIYYPGMELFIDPRGFGGPEFDPTNPQRVSIDGTKIEKAASIANALGIGGYHIVTKVKHMITPEKYETTVDAQFHYSGDGKQSLLASQGEKKTLTSKLGQKTKGKDINKCSNLLRKAQTDYLSALKGNPQDKK